MFFRFSRYHSGE